MEICVVEIRTRTCFQIVSFLLILFEIRVTSPTAKEFLIRSHPGSSLTCLIVFSWNPPREDVRHALTHPA
jgi:hypothetical protein